MLGSAYTSVPGNTTIPGDPPPITIGGNEIPTPTFTTAIDGVEKTTSIKRIDPKISFFIFILLYCFLFATI
jgi:hypothetical protein